MPTPVKIQQFRPRVCRKRTAIRGVSQAYTTRVPSSFLTNCITPIIFFSCGNKTKDILNTNYNSERSIDRNIEDLGTFEKTPGRLLANIHMDIHLNWVLKDPKVSNRSSISFPHSAALSLVGNNSHRANSKIDSMDCSRCSKKLTNKLARDYKMDGMEVFREQLTSVASSSETSDLSISL